SPSPSITWHPRTTGVLPRWRARVVRIATRSGLVLVEVAGQLQLVARGLGQLAPGPLVDDALQQLGAELLVAGGGGLQQPASESVARPVGRVVLAGDPPGDREALAGEPRELLEHRIVGARGADQAVADRLERQHGEQEPLLVVDRAVDVGARPEQRLEAAERLDRLAGLAQPAGAPEPELDLAGPP